VRRNLRTTEIARQGDAHRIIGRSRAAIMIRGRTLTFAGILSQAEAQFDLLLVLAAGALLRCGAGFCDVMVRD
jgi:hypothetical protein